MNFIEISGLCRGLNALTNHMVTVMNDEERNFAFRRILCFTLNGLVVILRGRRQNSPKDLISFPLSLPLSMVDVSPVDFVELVTSHEID